MPRSFQKPNLSLQMAGGVCANLLGPSACPSPRLSVPHVLIALHRPGALPINPLYGAKDIFGKSLSQGKDTDAKLKYL